MPSSCTSVWFQVPNTAIHPGFWMKCTVTNQTVCACISSGSCWWKSKLWTNISSWKREIRWVFLGILTGCTCRHWGELWSPAYCAWTTSRLRELDLKSSSLYLSHQDSDLGFSFQQQLEASTLAPELKDRISVRCFDFLKEVLVQYQMRLPASMEMLRKLELFCPKLVMSTINRPGVKDLPAEYFPYLVDTLESQWRNIASAGFSSDQAIDAFSLEV